MPENCPVLQDLKRSVETWDYALMEKSVKDALDQGLAPEVIVSQGLAKGMETISDLFNEAKIYLPQVMAAAKTMEGALEMIGPTMAHDTSMYRGTVVMGSVLGDIHEIGKNVCCAMLRGAGYNVIDLGPDVSPDKFVEAAEQYSADIVGGSALMTTTLVMQKNIVRAVRDADSKVLMIFGGAPCSREWVEEIGGDGYSASGSEIVALVNRLMSDDPLSADPHVLSTEGDSYE
ncbi:MAG: cobalamin-dependent protein [Candidatus Methanomethylophilaceae archaeon]|nr:cobalamin-dependent protein [Candidatus Methanomethylophilaceae archaeon]